MALKEAEKEKRNKHRQNDSIYGQRVNNRSITTPEKKNGKNGKKRKSREKIENKTWKYNQSAPQIKLVVEQVVWHSYLLE